MEIRQLKYFIAIADTGSFSEASRKCCLSQSAVSQQLKVLEDELGTRLLERTSHRIALTEAGQLLLPMARHIVESANECKERVADVSGLLAGELIIGLTPSLESFARWAMIRFMKLYPHVRLHLMYEPIPELIRLLRSGSVDVAFSMLVDGEHDWVDSLPVTEMRLCAVMRDTHPLSRRSSLSLADLEHQQLVLPEEGMQDRNAIERYLCQEGAGIRVRAVVNDISALLQLLRYTNCVSILSERSVQNVRELCAVPIQELQEPKVFYAHFLKGAYRKRSATVFLDIVKQIISEEKAFQR